MNQQAEKIQPGSKVLHFGDLKTVSTVEPGILYTIIKFTDGTLMPVTPRSMVLVEDEQKALRNAFGRLGDQ